MEEFLEPASVLYPRALTQVVGCIDVADKPRVQGGILVTFRDERGTLVTIRLRRPAADGLLQVLQSGSLVAPARLRVPHGETGSASRALTVDMTAVCVVADPPEFQPNIVFASYPDHVSHEAMSD
ncbi:MAG: hypothetical protein QOH31_4631 [Verrucomicrobiota bacterium]|jgi:hypothetical protein